MNRCAPLLLAGASWLAWSCAPDRGDGDGDVDSGPADGDTDQDADTDDDAEADGDGDVDADSDAPELVRQRPCTTRFAYERRGGELSVQLAGEWDWSAPAEMALTDGVYVLERDLAPGLYCYKLIIDGNWALDPGNAYRAYCDGVENSGMRVPDRSLPLLALDGEPGVSGSSFSARVLWSAGCGGAGPDEVQATIVHDFEESPVEALWSAADWSLTIDLADLEPGKHTVRVVGRDLEGNAAEPLLLPFWIEADAEEPWSWQDAVIYMVLTDRFRNGQRANDPLSIPEAEPTADWLGGDLRGVTEAIESGYFDELGVRALWLSPWNTAADGVDRASDGEHMVTGYHGYWPVEPRQVDSRLGTEDDLRGLVVAAHARGIRVLMDLVVNHVHADHVYFGAHPDWFNDGCVCGTPGCDWTVERLTCLFNPYMPDVDWQNEDASEQMISDALYWLEEFDLDGFRIDAVKHVDDGCVFNLGTRVAETFEQAGTDYYLDGETAMGWVGDSIDDNLPEYAMISRYIGEDGLDGQFDFVLHHAVAVRVFARSERGFVHLDYWTGQSQVQYPAGAVMTPFVGSHDSSRLLTVSDYRGQDAEHPADAAFRRWPEDGLPTRPDDDEPYERARLAFCWLLTIPGAPLIYMGDEHGEYGGADPDNRHVMRFDGELEARESQLLDEVRALGTSRQAVRPLRRGSYRSLGSTETFLPFVRETEDGETALVVVNGDAAQATVAVDLSSTNLSSATSLEEELGLGGAATLFGGTATVTVPARSCAVFTSPR